MMQHGWLMMVGAATMLQGCIAACECEASHIDVTVVDSNGDPALVSEVVFRIDGGAWQDAVCDDTRVADGEPCSAWWIFVDADANAEGLYEIQVLDGEEVLAEDTVDVMIPSGTGCCANYFNEDVELEVPDPVSMPE